MGRPRAKIDTHDQSEEVLIRHKAEKEGWKRERFRRVALGRKLELYDSAYR